MGQADRRIRATAARCWSSLTPVGEEVFEQLRAEYRALLHEEMAMLDDSEVETLAAAVEILDKLIARLSQ